MGWNILAQRFGILGLLSLTLTSIGCVTPDVWKSAAVGEVYCNRIVGFVGPDRHGEGRGIVVSYVNAAGLPPVERFVVVPLDADWRAAPGIAVRALEGQIPSKSRDADAPLGSFETHEAAWREIREGQWPEIRVGGKPSRRFIQVQHLRGGRIPIARRLGKQLLFFTPPGDDAVAADDPLVPPAPDPLEEERPAARWIVLPRTLPRDGGNQAGAIALAVLVTPFTLLYDATVVPVTTLVYLGAHVAAR